MVSIRISPLNEGTFRLTGPKAMSLSWLVAELPSFTDLLANDSQIDSQSSIRMGQVLSVPVEKITDRNELKTPDKQGLMNLQSTPVTTRQEREEWCAMQERRLLP